MHPRASHPGVTECDLRLNSLFALRANGVLKFLESSSFHPALLTAHDPGGAVRLGMFFS